MSRVRDLLRDLMGRLRPPARPGQPPAPPPPPPPPDRPVTGTPEALADGVFQAQNRERLSHGLPALRRNVLLDRAAAAQARDMAATGRVAHAGSDGSTPFQRLAWAGYRYSSAGENVAGGQRTVAQVMYDPEYGWMSSTGHRANILGRYAETGVAVADGNGVRYWCVTFGVPYGANTFVTMGEEAADPFPAPLPARAEAPPPPPAG